MFFCICIFIMKKTQQHNIFTIISKINAWIVNNTKRHSTTQHNTPHKDNAPLLKWSLILTSIDATVIKVINWDLSRQGEAPLNYSNTKIQITYMSIKIKKNLHLKPTRGLEIYKNESDHFLKWEFNLPFFSAILYSIFCFIFTKERKLWKSNSTSLYLQRIM